MELIIHLVVSGLSLGGIYALLSFSFSLIISTTRILNIAHGAFFIWGAGICSILVIKGNLHPLIAIPVILLIFALLASLFYWGIVKVLLKRGSGHLLSGSILATFGLALAMQSMIADAWMAYVNPQPTFLLPMELKPINIRGIFIPSNRLLVILLGGLMIVCIHFLLKKTFFGKSARAMAQNMEGFLILGLNPQRVTFFMITTAVLATSLSGILYALVIPLEAYEGLTLTLKALTVVILAGVGSLPGTIFAGILLGMAEVTGSYFFGAVWAPVIGFTILFLVLLIRPTGLFGRVTI